jgi:hypothetical protein
MTRIVWICLYLVCMILVVLGMQQARRVAIASYGGEHAQQDWDQWRHAATEASDAEGPVQRKPPRSDRPPALVLMQDYYFGCLAFGIVLSSVLFGTLALMFHGAIARPPA